MKKTWKKMKKHIFLNCKKYQTLQTKRKNIEIKTLISKTILGSSIFIIVLNQNLLEQAGAHWIFKASYKT